MHQRNEPNALLILQSIPGMGPIWAWNSIRNRRYNRVPFIRCPCQICRPFTGLRVIRNFTSEDNKMSKAGNPYLRCYLGDGKRQRQEAHPEYADFYARKYAEVTNISTKRALALTSRKLVRLVFGLLVKNQLYTGEKLDTEYNIIVELTFGYT